MAGKRWSKEEDQIFKAAIENGEKNVDIAAKLGRTLKSVQSRFGYLGLERPEFGKAYRNNRLKVLETYNVYEHNQNKTYAKCLCDCGNLTHQKLTEVKSGVRKSCGCLRDELARDRTIKRNYKHGQSNSRLYRTFASMKTRCYNSNIKNYHSYGGRGISMCDEWRNSFIVFQAWALNNGYSDSLTIDRIDVNGNYCPENCRWTTMLVQANNKQNSVKRDTSIEAFGETKDIDLWLEDPRCRIKLKTTIFYRLGAGWSPEEAISKPSERDRK